MGVVKAAVGCGVAALLLGHGLSTMDGDRRAALWGTARAAFGSPTQAPRPDPPLPPRPRNAPTPAPSPAPSGLDEEALPPDRFGQFHTGVEIGGLRLPVLVDTGASVVALRAEDADRLGIRPMPSDYRVPVDTANGRTLAAEVRLASVRLGGIEVRDVPALVAGPGQLGETLLGMSFLSRLSGVRIDRGRLVLSR